VKIKNIVLTPYVIDNKKVDSIPEQFHNLEEASDFWDTHSAADYWDESQEANFEIEFETEPSYFKLNETGKPEATTSLLTALESDCVEVRRDAAETLGIIREPTQEVVPALIQALGDTDEIVRANATDALAKIGEPAVTALAQALTKVLHP
jgi:HEAT repeat protein